MKAVQIDGHGGYEQIKFVEIPKPEKQEGHILVKIRSVGLNPADMGVVAGQLPFAKQPPLILGTEGAGIVEEGSDDFPKGTPVVVYGGLMGIVQDGTWREYVSVPPEFLFKMPRGITMPEAAVLPLVYLTAQASLIEGEFKAGQTVLVTGAGGGVGHAAYQLAILQGASLVIGTVGSKKKKDAMIAFIDKLFARPIVWKNVLGNQITADKVSEMRETYKNSVIDLSTENLGERIQELTEGKGVDFTIEMLGGEYFPQVIDATAPKGTVMAVGYVAGLEPTIHLMPILAKQLRVWGTNVFNLTADEMKTSMETVFSLIRDHNMRPAIEAKYKFEDIVEAVKHMTEKRPFGKIAVNLD